MTYFALFGAAVPGGIAAALLVLMFCGAGLRRGANAAAVLGTITAAVETIAAWLGLSAPVLALVLACLGGAAAVLVFREEAAFRGGPAAVFFCAARLLDRGMTALLMSVAAEWIRVVLWTVWAALLVLAALLLAKCFPDTLWQAAREGAGDSDGALRLSVILAGMGVIPLAGALLCASPVRLGAQAAVCGALALALWAAWYALRAAEKDGQLAQNAQTRAELEQFMAIIRSQRHDYNLHLHAVAGLAREERYGEIQGYLSDVVSDSQDVNAIMRIRDPMIGALLSGYRDLAREQGCELSISVGDDLGSIVSTPYDTNRIIGNLLQNALDEVTGGGVADKRIRLETLRRGGSSVIRVSNAVRTLPDPERVFAYGRSGKSAHEGIGLNSVRRILELYHGTIYCELGQNRVDFVARIPNRI